MSGLHAKARLVAQDEPRAGPAVGGRRRWWRVWRRRVAWVVSFVAVVSLALWCVSLAPHSASPLRSLVLNGLHRSAKPDGAKSQEEAVDLADFLGESALELTASGVHRPAKPDGALAELQRELSKQLTRSAAGLQDTQAREMERYASVLEEGRHAQMDMARRVAAAVALGVEERADGLRGGSRSSRDGTTFNERGVAKVALSHALAVLFGQTLADVAVNDVVSRRPFESQSEAGKLSARALGLGNRSVQRARFEQEQARGLVTAIESLLGQPSALDHQPTSNTSASTDLSKESAFDNGRIEDKAIIKRSFPSLFCFSLMLPFGYELALLKAQHSMGVGIFACDEAAAVSNASTVAPFSRSQLIQVTGLLEGSHGSKFGSADNTLIFNRVWREVVRKGRYRFHDWAVKVDPDAVFFPLRLKNILVQHMPENQVPLGGIEPAVLQCGVCGLPWRKDQTCASRVKELQDQDNHTSCIDALRLVARSPPHDCGCECDDLACNVPAHAAIYLNTWKVGLHGPIEVLSRRAVAIYVSGLPLCTPFLSLHGGGDKFLDECMEHLGVERVSEDRLLNEAASKENPAPCDSDDVTFHPFQSVQSYFDCWGFAQQFGRNSTGTRTVEHGGNVRSNDEHDAKVSRVALRVLSD